MNKTNMTLRSEIVFIPSLAQAELSTERFFLQSALYEVFYSE